MPRSLHRIERFAQLWRRFARRRLCGHGGGLAARGIVVAALPFEDEAVDDHGMDAITRRVIAGPESAEPRASQPSCEHCGEPEAEIGIYAHDVWLWLHRDCAGNGAIAEFKKRRLARQRRSGRNPA
jgi:hypothetical protein